MRLSLFSLPFILILENNERQMLLVRKVFFIFACSICPLVFILLFCVDAVHTGALLFQSAVVQLFCLFVCFCRGRQNKNSQTTNSGFVLTLQGSRNSSRSSSPSVRIMPPDKTGGRGYLPPDDPAGTGTVTSGSPQRKWLQMYKRNCNQCMQIGVAEGIILLLNFLYH